MENNDEEMKVSFIEIKDIFADPVLNCRGDITPHEVIDLAQDIDKVGLMQPITIQPYDKKEGFKYRTIAGHRRLMAFTILKRETIPAIVRHGLSELDAAVLNFKENLQRKDLNLLQEALSLKKFKDANYTLKEVSDMVGKSTGWVQIRYNLLSLPEPIQQAAAAGFIKQEQVKDIYGMKSEQEQFEAVKRIKESKERGERRAIKLKKPKVNPFVKRERKRTEIFDMISHIIDSVDANFGTRCLAWASGEISDLELYEEIKGIANEQGIPYHAPTATVEST